MSLEDLKERRKKLKANTDITINNMEKLANESYRVASVASNSRNILNDLEREFESATGLQGNDIRFLFAAVGLQVARIVIINSLTKVEPAGPNNRKEKALHEFQSKILKNFNPGDILEEKPYYASMKHIIERKGVPYDATASFDKKAIERLVGVKDSKWSIDISEFLITEKLDLFGGANHRYSTLGHDPILGLIFGTGNIMTNTITCVKNPIIGEGIGVPVLTTNHVIYTTEYKEPRIATYGSTIKMLSSSIVRTKDQPEAFVAALIKQIIHIGTDLYTPCGIQIPGANLVLSNSNVEKLSEYISTGDILKAGTSALIAEFINTLINMLHTLMYDSTSGYSKEVYNVRTRKIILYSNIIATCSNVIWVGANVIAGDKSQVKNLDIGGLIVLLKRLYTDTEYIRQIKEEFVLGGFRNMIKGDDLVLEEPIWE